MANTANADRCEIVCGSIEVDKQLEVSKNGRYTLEIGELQQDIKTKAFKMKREDLEKLKNGKEYYKALKKQEKYQEKLQEDGREME